MTTEEAQKVLDELQGVRPGMLTGEGKRLFEAIMKIADERDRYKIELEQEKEKNKDFESYWVHIDDYRKLKRQADIKDEYLKLIIGIGFDYDAQDGSIDGLKGLVDELVNYAKMAIDNDDKTAMYEGGKGMKNILLEDIDSHIPKID